MSEASLRKSYLEVVRPRYLKGDRKERSRVLDELCRTFGINRAYAARRLRQGFKPRKKPGRKRVYSPEARQHLRKLWILLNQICSKRLKAALPIWLPFYEAPGFDMFVKAEIAAMSASTIERVLQEFRFQMRRKWNSGTRPNRMIRHIVPIKPFDRKVTAPGYCEADTVAHCGGSLMGQFAWTLTFTDIFSGWTENQAIWGKSGIAVLSAMEKIEDRLPFTIAGLNVDCGSEFLNDHLIGYFGPNPSRKREKFVMTRSREYRKNDNCHVEQKNFTHVRELFGYDRISESAQIALMNSIFENEHNLLMNYFYPQAKLDYKLRVGSRYRRKYLPMKTPYERILECPDVPQETKDKLTVTYRALNPFELRKRLEAKLKQFFQAMNKPADNQEGSAA